jgi:hypothetical protein
VQNDKFPHRSEIGEAAVIKRLIDRLGRRESWGKGIRLSSRKAASAAKRLERYAEAAALAQAGAQDLAQEIIRGEIHQRPKILVVGSEEGFSRPLVDYAVELAKRMGYEIIAVNCISINHEAGKPLTGDQEKLFMEFRRRAAKGVEAMASRTAELGVPLRHMVKVGLPDRCILELEAEVSRLTFVLTEPEASHQVRLETSVPIFSLVR